MKFAVEKGIITMYCGVKISFFILCENDTGERGTLTMSEITNVGVNISEKATLIWNVADMLRGPFKPHEYGLVILPMTVVKRFHD